MGYRFDSKITSDAVKPVPSKALPVMVTGALLSTAP